MLSAVSHWSSDMILAGIIWSLALGLAAGNYACSLVHRLPRGRLILDKTPYCGSCGALLQVKDLFPVFSALWLRHRCRYCKAPFPTSHTWTELAIGALFVLAFLRFGFSEMYVLIVVLGTFLTTLAAIQANEKIIMGRILLCIIATGMVLRTLVDGTIYGFFEGGVLGMIVGAILWHRRIEKIGHVYMLPKPAQMLVVGGICVGSKLFFPFFLTYAIFWAALWIIGKTLKKTPPYTASFGLAVLYLLLYGSIKIAF